MWINRQVPVAVHDSAQEGQKEGSKSQDSDGRCTSSVHQELSASCLRLWSAEQQNSWEQSVSEAYRIARCSLPASSLLKIKSADKAQFLIRTSLTVGQGLGPTQREERMEGCGREHERQHFQEDFGGHTLWAEGPFQTFQADLVQWTRS